MTEENAWFKAWFNTPYYHILYKHRDFDEASAFIDKLCAYLNLSKGRKVLDLACGKGRHSIYLNKKGMDVTGADLSVENIKAARAYENGQLRFVVHDMRKRMQPDQFDCVFNLFTSFGYFESEEENLQTLASIHTGLKEGGTFIIDFLNVNRTLALLNLEEHKIVDGIDFQINRRLEGRFIYKHISFEADSNKFDFEERIMAITKEDFEGYFEKLGFKIRSVFGDYNLNDFDALNSERLIFIADKV